MTLSFRDVQLHREILELIKRVQIPGYELVRNLSPRRQDSKRVSPVLSHGYYLQSEIREMLGWANETSPIAAQIAYNKS